MQHIVLIIILVIFAPVSAETMYEWRDPGTGKLQLGDKPPSGGVKYWIEGVDPEKE